MSTIIEKNILKKILPRSRKIGILLQNSLLLFSHFHKHSTQNCVCVGGREDLRCSEMQSISCVILYQFCIACTDMQTIPVFHKPLILAVCSTAGGVTLTLKQRSCKLEFGTDVAQNVWQTAGSLESDRVNLGYDSTAYQLFQTKYLTSLRLGFLLCNIRVTLPVSIITHNCTHDIIM